VATVPEGFVWFFSVLAAFSAYVDKGCDVILLLDEPGLNLHAKAQEDLLRFIEERLVTRHQVIYSTHSPFMIDPRHLDRVRIVEDRDATSSRQSHVGTVVTDDFHTGSTDTLFPLQGALGYSLAQTLFVSPRNLLVEGPSDLIYLTQAADLLGKGDLLNEWTIVPVGGADKVATFVSLLGAHELEIAVLVDVAKKDKQKFDNLLKGGYLGKHQLIRITDFTDASQADIEDLLDRSGYLELVNGHYADLLEDSPIMLSDFPADNPRVVKCVEYAWKNKGLRENFSHYKPAMFLNQNIELRESVFTQEALENFESIFERLEALT